jgi:D-glycero-D-manno-heptose 1,7-bisphosphate phosphatase
LEDFKKMGFILFIISNQPDISRGFIKKGVTEKISQIIYDRFPIKEILICPHDDHHYCNCRKPKPGMIFELSKKYDIDINKSFLIGDNWKDTEAGQKAGCKTIILNKKYNQIVDADYRTENLITAVKLIKSLKIK